MNLEGKSSTPVWVYFAGAITIATVFSVLLGVLFLLDGDKSRLRFGPFLFAVAFQFVGWLGGSAIVVLLRRWLVSRRAAAGIGFIAAQPFTVMVVLAMQAKEVNLGAGLIAGAAVTCGAIGAGIAFSVWEDSAPQ